ncbi:hypothetical protein NBRC116583_07800 [Arenicella sp. 4NH20-0111]|uniref:endonuclease/exonuclease/phosphatase family protein n=1 Tax=Arenicella sp. 4NH20-0111 TaxID=3127648 RepID=UPI003109CF2C
MIKIIALIVIFAIALWARKATPAGNKSGKELRGKFSENYSPDKLRVATYNIQTGKSDDGKRNINASADVIKDVDLAGIQEVYAPSLLNLFGVGGQQSEHLSSHGGFAWIFNATRRRWLREHRGNALLSKINVVEWHTIMLPDQSGKSFRNMTVAKVEWQGRSFHFINTHLHTKNGREEQLDVVLREFAKYPLAVLVGDFNSKAQTQALASALKDIEITDAISVAGIDANDPDRIDWILTKGFNVHEGRTLEVGVSDHPFYEVSLSYKQ